MERLKNISMIIIAHKEKMLEFVRFCIVGTIAAGIHYGIYLIMRPYININVAYTIGYIMSFVCNFFMTSYFTFRRSPSIKRLLGFSGGHLINYVLHMILFNFFLYLGISQILAPLLVLLVVIPTNFFILHFVFHHKAK